MFRMKSRRRRTAAAAAVAAPPSNVVSSKSGDYSSSIAQQQQNCYEGERLVSLLKSMEREIESARVSETGGVIPEKLWLKQQFLVGVNEVTRVLERMSPISQTQTEIECLPPSTTSKLQAIILAADCNPRWLTKHLLLGLASSRGVPIIFVKGNNKSASLRLGQLLKLKTAIAIGVKARGNSIINQLVDKILVANEI